MNKYEYVKDVTNEVSLNITRDADSFKHFLKSTAGLYKYPFDEQLMIYAQNPEATACATMDMWNKRFKCWVNRGSKGIAIIDKTNPKSKITYVFDIKNVHPVYGAKLPKLWKMNGLHEQGTKEYFDSIYSIDKTSDFTSAVIEFSAAMVDDMGDEIAGEVMLKSNAGYNTDYLEAGLQKAHIKETLKQMCAYTILTRCGYEIDPLDDRFSFEYISEFNTAESISALGDEAAELIKPILKDIALEVDKINKRTNVQKGVAPNKKMVYDEEKGGASNGIYESGRLLSAEYRTAGAGGRTQTLRTAQMGISEEASSFGLHGDDNERDDVAAFDGNSGASRTEVRFSDGADGKSTGSNRTAKARGSDALGSENEQHQTRSGGDSAKRDNLQLSLFPTFPSPEEQINTLENFGADEAAPFSFDTEYSLLSRLKHDCDYFLGNGNRSAKHLWAGDVTAHISKMRELYEILPIKPEWLGTQNIDEYERQMNLEETTNQDVNSKSYTKEAVGDDKKSEGEGTENYLIKDDELGVGTKGEKFKRNVAAIRLLKELEEGNVQATADQQEILSRYVGWGGLSESFESGRPQQLELKNLLSEDEYSSAQESTLNAHYTSPLIIKKIYETLSRFGFSSGSILEPSCGIGNFIGAMPLDMQKNSDIYGVELDDISGRIAQKIYTNANIQITGFEKTAFPNETFDLAVGNVPFGQYHVNDKSYNAENFLIHDYFVAKMLDKVRAGGIVAVITSKGTLDKENSSARKYFAQRAELLGAVRLPNTAFKQNAGTEVTSDILLFQKREILRKDDEMPAWVETASVDGIKMNRYFAEHPEMIAGKMQMVTSHYGMESTCSPLDGDFGEQLSAALNRIDAVYEEKTINEIELEEADVSEKPIAVNSKTEHIRNYSYAVINEGIFFREDSFFIPVEMGVTAEERIRQMIPIRECLRELISMQLNGAEDELVKLKQKELSRVYDEFTVSYGRICDNANKRVFDRDESYPLLCSLENFDDDGHFSGKADIFTKRTIKKTVEILRTDTASEALAVSLSQNGIIDLSYMAGLCDKSVDEVIEELKGVIFKNPLTMEYEPADEYLSGNVRSKIEMAKSAGKEYSENVSALEKVQPKELSATEIDLRLGATWIDPKYVDEFMRETFGTPFYYRSINVEYSKVTGEWHISSKNLDVGPLVSMKYGTQRVNAYKLLEDSLNLKDVQVFDTIEDEGKEKRILNKKETALALQRQELIREEFRSWVFKNPDRRKELCDIYNRKFNSIRPREYSGEHLSFPGMNPEVSLREHQKNAVARIIYGNNTLLAHVVGAGKTYTMAAAAMEMKRMGMCQKSLFVVPNHLTEQWGKEFLTLYPGANILVTTKKDFEPANRKKFCSRIATGDYDAVIIGHSQFEKIPLSKERQEKLIRNQIEEISIEVDRLKYTRNEQFTVKQMAKLRKSLQVKLEKLSDIKQDNVITFEELGVDRIFVDESHNYKNLYLYTKMRNVAGISSTEAKKSSDMYAKCQYIDEITNGCGITFATGTPISNSMTEMYTNMRYLQGETLEALELNHFDSWASTFGETQTGIELSPEGTGFRSKTRFAKFFNLPELTNIFKEAADIKTADMLDLPRPKANYHNVVLEPSDAQKEMIKSLAARAECVRSGSVDPSQDNMLKITNDGRKLALSEQLIDENLPDDPASKVKACVDNAFKLWQDTMKQKSAQLIFCDLSTPKKDGTYSVYAELKERLIAKGVPEKEIAFIHDAKTEVKKAELFAKVRSGQVRFLIGSTAKMGAGTNVQDRLIALHHLDVPWRPSDIEQQEGRILRQGNQNAEVEIFRYIKKGTFDSYSWQILENKAKFIGQIMTSKSPVRSAEDIDDATLTCAEVKALATGNPLIKEKMDLDIQVSKLKLLKSNYEENIYRLQDDIAFNYPSQIMKLKQYEAVIMADIKQYNDVKPADESFSLSVFGKSYDERKIAGAAILEACKKATYNSELQIGEYLGFKLMAAKTVTAAGSKYVLNIKGAAAHKIELGDDPSGCITRINNSLSSMGERLIGCRNRREEVEKRLKEAENEVKLPFAQEEELKKKMMRLKEVELMLDEKGEETEPELAMDDNYKTLSIVEEVCVKTGNLSFDEEKEVDNAYER